MLTNSLNKLNELNGERANSASCDVLDGVEPLNKHQRKCVDLDQTPIQTPKFNLFQQPQTPNIASLVKHHRFVDLEQTPSSNYTNQLAVCNSFVYATCRDALNDEDLQIEDEDENLENLELDEANNDAHHSSTGKQKIPTIDDKYLKYYARLVYNLDKLMEFKNDDEKLMKRKAADESTGENDTFIHHAHSIDFLNSNNDQPLYVVKITNLFAQLNEFSPDYWTLINGQNMANIRKIFSKIKKLIKMVKDSINCLFQVNFH